MSDYGDNQTEEGNGDKIYEKRQRQKKGGNT